MDFRTGVGAPSSSDCPAHSGRTRPRPATLNATVSGEEKPIRQVGLKLGSA